MEYLNIYIYIYVCKLIDILRMEQVYQTASPGWQCTPSGEASVTANGDTVSVCTA